MDLISVIVPCYNVEKYVEKCITTLKNQKYKNIEVLMVDDGSKDNTAKIIKENIKDDSRFTYYKKKNGGQSDARNYGLDRAKGKYICFVDSDDHVHEDYIYDLYNSIKGKKNTISVCYFDRVYQDKVNVNKIENNIPFMIKHPAPWNKMFTSEMINKNNLRFVKGIWYEDLNFFLKILTNVNKFEVIEKGLYYYIQNPTSTMHKVDDRIYQIFDCLEDVEKYVKDNKIDSSFLDYVEYSYVYHVLIGTIYRASFFENFSIEDFNKIIDRVTNKYPNCWNNKYISTLPFIYRLYIKMLKHKCFRKSICFFLKRFNKYMNL